MKKILMGLVVLGFVFGITGLGMAADNVNQTVTFEVSAINEISVSGNPAAMTVSAATAGSQPTEVSNALTTYSITTNETTMKITGVLDEAMPANVTLKINLATVGGTNVPDVTLTASPASLVTGITQLVESANTITYKLSATVAAGIVASDTRTVTLTIVNEV